jgi:hypothetical protein
MVRDGVPGTAFAFRQGHLRQRAAAWSQGSIGQFPDDCISISLGKTLIL